MNKRSAAFIGLGLLVGVILIAGLASAGFIAYQALTSPAAQAAEQQLDLPLPAVEQEPTTVPTPEPQTPVGADIDLANLFEPFWESYRLLKENYVEQPVDDNVLAQGAVDGLTALLEDAGVSLDAVTVPENAPSAAGLSDLALTPEDAQKAFQPFWELWRKLNYAELNDDLTYEILMQESLSQLFASLGDLHTSYMNPDDYRQVQIDLAGNYEGIGAWVDPSAEFLTIIAPMEGSPAEDAGLKPGDRIIAVDGDDMTGIDGNLVIRRVLGPAGTDVVLTIERDGEAAPFDVTITRARITIPTVESKILDNNIAYLRLYNFGSDSAAIFAEELQSLLDQNPDALILDLRNNGGGYLHAVVNIGSDFIEKDEVVLYEIFGDGTRNTHIARDTDVHLDIPLVVLINGGTASASEILAGLIQDYGVGTLIGDTTFGKGSVQLPFELSHGQGGIRVTIAKWLTPNERHIHGIGLDPDMFVEMEEESIIGELGNDPQLQAAIDLLLGQ